MTVRRKIGKIIFQNWHVLLKSKLKHVLLYLLEKIIIFKNYNNIDIFKKIAII